MRIGSVMSCVAQAGHGRSYDSHLSPLGYKAASELASELVQRKDRAIVQVEHIVSSPFLRCVETADAVAKTLNLSIKIEPGITEVGSAASHMASQEQLLQQFPRIDRDYEPVVELSELSSNEYSDDAAARRAARVGQAIRRRFKYGAILFVGHGASCLGLVRAFGGEGYVGYCRLSHFCWTGPSQRQDTHEPSDEPKGG